MELLHVSHGRQMQVVAELLTKQVQEYKLAQQEAVMT
jgi:hypothetical protein